jgi:hypothetical protein
LFIRQVLRSLWHSYACARIGAIPVPASPLASTNFDVGLAKMALIAHDCQDKLVLTRICDLRTLSTRIRSAQTRQCRLNPSRRRSSSGNGPAPGGTRPDATRFLNHRFGESGPYARQRAYDPVIQSLCGLAENQRDRDTGRPRMIRTIIADYTTALTAAHVITAALFAKERTGQGQHVRIAMLDATIAYLWPEAMPSLTFVGSEIDPSDSELGPDLVFATQDRYIAAAALSDDEWSGMCRSLRREDLIGGIRLRRSPDCGSSERSIDPCTNRVPRLRGFPRARRCA